jgi:hypothetical protein
MIQRLLLAVGVCVACAASSYAATVNFILDLTGPAGTFNVYATTSAGDNIGLSLYGVELTGPGIQLDHLSTATMDAEGAAAASGSAGFTVLRGVDVFGDDRVGIRGSQDIFGGSSHLLYGLGQNAGSLDANGLAATGSVTSPTWGAEYLLEAEHMPSMSATSTSIWKASPVRMCLRSPGHFSTTSLRLRRRFGGAIREPAPS